MIAAAVIAFLLGLVTIAILEAPWFHPDRARGASAPMRGGPAYDPMRRREPGQGPRPRPSERWELMSESTPRSDGATSGRSNPGTEPGP